MKISSKLIYKNKNTGNRVGVLKMENNLIQVRYIKSGTKCWFTIPDFARVFEVYNA